MGDTQETADQNVAKVEAEIEATQEQIDAQAEKVAKADSPSEEAKENGKLEKLLDKLDALTTRFDAIEAKLNEPTVPAPEAKTESLPAVDKSEVETVKGQADEPEAKPKRRRLGAWG